jgi:hypothetical protein
LGLTTSVGAVLGLTPEVAVVCLIIGSEKHTVGEFGPT